MNMTPLDWTIVGLYFLIVLGIALYYSKRAGQNTSEFFLSGRRMTWWLAGISMVATTFAADTPMAVTELVAQNGIAGNWIWWNFAFGGMLTVFFFARLWRRCGIQTDVEFVEVRYTGSAAAWLRGIKAVYFGLLLNIIIIGWVSLAMETAINVLWPELTIFGHTTVSIGGLTMSAALVIVSLLVVLVSVFALLSGLWGVAVTDVMQFILAMIGSILMAIFVLRIPEVGGIAGLKSHLPAETFRFFPTIGEASGAVAAFALSIPAFVAFIGIQWWSSWYPGSEPGGGGYSAQRMMGTASERDATFSALLFTIAHYCIRPWPWIIVALASLVLYPDLTHSREGFILVMRDVLPIGVLGIVFAAFLAAFMSTISTQLNWGVSYLVNDFWRRFVNPDRSERHYVFVSRTLTFIVGLLSILLATQLESISQAWTLIITASAGLGTVLILRWYWWRINAWSELVATLAPIVMVLLTLLGVPIPGIQEPFPSNLFVVVGVTTALWLIATFLTKPTDPSTLEAFYTLVRPAGPGWRPIAALHPDIQPDATISSMARQWCAGIALVYACLFSAGYLILGNTLAGILMLLVAIASTLYLRWTFDQNKAH
ncbi:MAG: Na+:solute symporter [Rhodothermaceae bacterium]|nr:Na+:solute symporter [Rhodothermaceae bacterium]MXZ57003.1 Na+:solute symporter [Rhodothermaceae bacterium]MYB90738.1 Na+:solute symporter [Rhodothermaceae bacterium]MYD68705.1 Na+:solute symporter [Rhodothermaceae bacterium]MYG45294.1 Na+:solute symporter [Rhodothermaceae bacterium]